MPARAPLEELRASAWAMAGLQAENVRLQRRIAALESAAAGWRALAESGGVIAFAMDGQGAIRWLTPEASGILSLPASAGGLPGTATNHLDGVDLHAEARRSLDRRETTERRVTAHAGRERYLMRLLPYASPDGTAEGVVAIFEDAAKLARKDAEVTLVEELNHRIRNIAQMVLSIASTTRRHATSLEEFSRSFAGRILAMGRTQDILVQSGWTGVMLQDLVRRQVEPLIGDPTCLTLDGPKVRLTPKAALALDLVLHELGTNALKHGALSVPEGKVRISWSQDASDGTPRIVLCWHECGGPRPASCPSRRGFGSELIERQARYGLGGSASMEYAPEGLRARVVLSAANLVRVD
ncbi:sensor histidine kinase [Dankookia sp. P2]|uniref:sensor histidine kinase n=1 Tax=Dankookia sp. P2 TaxID=3423955 RepID=UPI003D67E75F